MQKRGQVTVFIIVGIIILAVAALIFYLGSLTTENLDDENEFVQISSFQIFTEGCLQTIAEEGIFYIGESGGYYNLDPLAFKYELRENLEVPIYVYYDSYYIPDISIIESQLDMYIEDHLNECLANFSSFTKQGWEITGIGDFSVDSEIKPEFIEVKLNYPLSIEDNGLVTDVDHFEEVLDLDFYGYYNIINESLLRQQDSPNMILIGDLSQLSSLYEFEFVIDNLGEDMVLYNYLFDNSLRSDQPYVYNYIVKYDWEGIFEE
ncbi:MAG: hypothetical protein ABIG93_04305 [archaeon]|nr:hypothetical protein [Nanoarchaeota archaeon]